jgi:hypothetical protein
LHFQRNNRLTHCRAADIETIRQRALTPRLDAPPPSE